MVNTHTAAVLTRTAAAAVVAEGERTVFVRVAPYHVLHRNSTTIVLRVYFSACFSACFAEPTDDAVQRVQYSTPVVVLLLLHG